MPLVYLLLTILYDTQFFRSRNKCLSGVKSLLYYVINLPIYITLMKLTENGIKTIKEAPKRIESGIKYLEKLGGKLLGFYVTFGEYDYVGVAEVPNDEVAMTFLLRLGAAGNIKTTTLKAFTREQLSKIVKEFP